MEAPPKAPEGAEWPIPPTPWAAEEAEASAELSQCLPSQPVEPGMFFAACCCCC